MNTPFQTYSADGRQAIIDVSHVDLSLFAPNYLDTVRAVSSNILARIKANVLLGPYVMQHDGRIHSAALIKESLQYLTLDLLTGKATLDIFTCGNESDPGIVAKDRSIVHDAFGKGIEHCVISNHNPLGIIVRGNEERILKDAAYTRLDQPYHHLIVDGFGIDHLLLEDPERLNRIMHDIYLKGETQQLIFEKHYQFDASPLHDGNGRQLYEKGGITGMSMFSDGFGHYHSYNEHGYFAADFLSFGTKRTPNDILGPLKAMLGTERIYIRGFVRDTERKRAVPATVAADYA
ncbi:MAG: S-adenosylmethionine decarboxylase [archaeon]